MENKYGVERLGTDKVLVHQIPVHPLTQAECFNLAAWLAALGKRLEGGESFSATLKRVERFLDGK